jgi:tmRNA-binding protein
MPEQWEPATSKPGEMYTPEGQIQSIGAFARGLKNHDPRNRRHRRSMQRTGLLIVGGAVVFVALVVLISAIF